MPAVALNFLVTEFRLGKTFFNGRKSPSGNGGDNTNRIAFLDWRALFLQITNVFLIHINVDEISQFAVILEKMFLQFRELRD